MDLNKHFNTEREIQRFGYFVPFLPHLTINVLIFEGFFPVNVYVNLWYKSTVFKCRARSLGMLRPDF